MKLRLTTSKAESTQFKLTEGTAGIRVKLLVDRRLLACVKLRFAQKNCSLIETTGGERPKTIRKR